MTTRNVAYNGWLLASAFAATLCALSQGALADDPGLTPKNNAVTRDPASDSVTNPSAHNSFTVSPDAGAPIFRKDATPPSGYLFKDFGENPAPAAPVSPYFQLAGAFIQVLAAAPSDAQAVHMAFMLSAQNTANAFPVIGYGNLKPAGSGSSGSGTSPAGGGPKHWSAGMNPSGPTIALEVNADGRDDNYVAYGDNGATLTVRVIGGSTSANYMVDLSDCANGSPSGDVDYSATPVSVAGGGGSASLSLHGRTIGGVLITGSSPGVTSGTVAATVAPRVAKVQFQLAGGAFQDIPTTGLYVHKGTTVTFKAIPDPSTAAWPQGSPVWSGTSGAAGTGETCAVTFNTASTSMSDYATVTASCGTSSATANVVRADDDYGDIAFAVQGEGTTSATVVANVTYRLWEPANQDGTPANGGAGGSVVFSLPTQMEWAYGETPDLTLTTAATWSYANGVTSTQTYVLRTGVNAVTGPDPVEDHGIQSAAIQMRNVPWYSCSVASSEVPMSRAARIQEYGGPDELGFLAADAPAPVAALDKAGAVVQMITAAIKVGNRITLKFNNPLAETRIAPGGQVGLSLTLATSAGVDEIGILGFDLATKNPSLSATVVAGPFPCVVNGNAYDPSMGIWQLSNCGDLQDNAGWANNFTLNVGKNPNGWYYFRQAAIQNSFVFWGGLFAPFNQFRQPRRCDPVGNFFNPAGKFDCDIQATQQITFP